MILNMIANAEQNSISCVPFSSMIITIYFNRKRSPNINTKFFSDIKLFFLFKKNLPFQNVYKYL